MPRRPLFSVVIPAYNCAAYVGQALKSALAQRVEGETIEVIAVDDGSTDGTSDIIAAFGERVTLLRARHGGVSRARNAGIAASNGRYLAFLDADDYWLKDRLRLAAAFLESNPGVFVNTDYYIELNGKVTGLPYYRSRSFLSLFKLDSGAQFEFALEGNFISSMAIVPRERLERCGGFNPSLRYGEDWDLWLRLLRSGCAVRLIEEPCAVYRLNRPGSTTARHDAQMARDRLRVLAHYRDDVSPFRWQQAKHVLRRLVIHEAWQRFRGTIS